MGIVYSATKINRSNLSMLHKPSYFKEIARPQSVVRNSVIDENQLKRKAIIIAQRKLNRKLLLATVGSLMIFVSVLLYTLLL